MQEFPINDLTDPNILLDLVREKELKGTFAWAPLQIEELFARQKAYEESRAHHFEEDQELIEDQNDRFDFLANHPPNIRLGIQEDIYKQLSTAQKQYLLILESHRGGTCSYQELALRIFGDETNIEGVQQIEKSVDRYIADRVGIEGTLYKGQPAKGLFMLASTEENNRFYGRLHG